MCKILTVSVQNHTKSCSFMQIMREIALFSGKIYSAVTNFTRPLFMTVVTNLNSATHGRKSCRCPELQLPLKRRAGASKPQVSPPSNLMVPALVSTPWSKPTMEQAHHGTSPPWIKPAFKPCKAGDVLKAPLIY